MKEHTCCFTGHRPQEFPWGHNEEWEECVLLRELLAAEIGRMRERGVTTFVSGMALGVDMWAAELVLECKRAEPDAPIRLCAALPFEGQANRWSVAYRERYFDTLAQADEVVILHEHYTKGCMFERDRYMVDRSAHMIAVYNGSPKGGTKYTLDYALSQGLAVVALHPELRTRSEFAPVCRLRQEE